MDTITYQERKARLLADIGNMGGRPYGMQKKTPSNLYRYTGSQDTSSRKVDLSDFNHVLHVDAANCLLDVEGLTTFQQIADATLQHNLVPWVTPELKHITAGGAIAGLGIESSSYRHGFVHDAMISAEVLLPGGEVVECTATNHYADLFHALPNSYGTLGYVLRARLHLTPALPYVQISIRRYPELESYLQAMLEATTRKDIDFVEGLIFAADSMYLMTARFTQQVPALDDIMHSHVFYKLVLERDDIYLTTRDYLFRYDPDWFWNVPETPAYNLFRRLAPETLRNSGFYYRYTGWRKRMLTRLGWQSAQDMEPLIQDWQVPWAKGSDFVRFALENVDLRGKPWLVTPIKTGFDAGLYPLRTGETYCNLGSYCQIPSDGSQSQYAPSKHLDEQCFAMGGLKMLYSSFFLPESVFDAKYNGAAFAQLKRKYDPFNQLPRLYQLSATTTGQAGTAQAAVK